VISSFQYCHKKAYEKIYHFMSIVQGKVQLAAPCRSSEAVAASVSRNEQAVPPSTAPVPGKEKNEQFFFFTLGMNRGVLGCEKMHVGVEMWKRSGDAALRKSSGLR
jgi:hypothetical protein